MSSLQAPAIPELPASALTASRKALAIPELLLIIISHMPRRDRVAMTQVCRYFWKVAISLIWDEVPDVRQHTTRHPISRIVPKDFKFEKSLRYRLSPLVSSYLPRPAASPDWNPQINLPDIESTPWSRFRQHSVLVRDFTMSLPTAHAPLGYLIWALGSAGMKPLFPGLRSLRITAAASELTPKVMASLVSPSIHHLTMKFDGMQAPLESSSVIEAITMTRSLQLRTAFIKATSKAPLCPNVTVAIAEAIRSQPRLRSLCVIGMAPHAMEMFAAASRLEGLEVITVTEWENARRGVHNEVGTLAALAGGDTFPSLKNISMTLAREALPSTLASITSSSLKHLKLRLKESSISSAYPLDGCLDELHRFTSLITIALAFPHTTSTWADFAPLLICSRLRILKLEGRVLPAVIGNQELENMARSWPQLEVLTIEGDSSRAYLERSSTNEDERPRVNLSGLICLAVHCPRLRKLRLSIDARIIPNMGSFPAVGEKVKELSFPMSCVASGGDEERSIARFIADLWPNQEPPSPQGPAGDHGPWANIAVRHPRWLQGDDECPIWGRIWMMVYVELSRRAGWNV